MLRPPDKNRTEQIRVRNEKLFFLFLNQNICFGCSKEPSQCRGSFEHPKHMFKLKDIWLRNSVLLYNDK